ncbi:MAG: alpha/beta hydrolase, partial [Blastocatellia bacterium]
MQALGAALRQKGSFGVEEKAMPTDHTFSDHRIALQAVVVDWL